MYSSADDEEELIVLDPYRYATEEAATKLRASFDEYIDLRIHGIPAKHAVVKAFCFIKCRFDTDNAEDVAMAVESNDYFQAEFPKRLQAARLDVMWNPRKAAHSLLCLVQDDCVRDSVRLNAMKELNVLAAITIVDENGKTRAGRHFADFYPDAATKPHPEPGTPEAEDMYAELTRH